MTAVLVEIWKLLVLAIARPYIWAELPGWGKVYWLFIGGHERDQIWVTDEPRYLRHKSTNFILKLDMTRWADRIIYFLGRPYDLDLQLFSKLALRPGDTAVDIGSNVGMMTLDFAYFVGETGKVISFEPNPVTRSRHIENLELNKLENVTVHPFGLSDRATRMTLYIPKINDLVASVGGSDYEESETDTRMIEVIRGDTILDDEHPALIKIDVEGYECAVLRGLEKVFESTRPIVLTEVIESHLHRSGSSIGELVTIMTAMGYHGYRLGTVRRGISHHLSLTQFNPDLDFTGDVVWLHPADERAQQLLRDAPPGSL